MVLESVSNLASVYHQVDVATERTLAEVDRSKDENSRMWTEKARVDAALAAYQRKKMLLTQFLLAFVQVATGPLSALVTPLTTGLTDAVQDVHETLNHVAQQALNSSYHGFMAVGLNLKQPE